MNTNLTPEEHDIYLLSIRKLYQKIGKSKEWTTYIADLRERNARLPALKDEMAKAKL